MATMARAGTTWTPATRPKLRTASAGKGHERFKLEPQAKVHSCYEAGRDGWWLHPWLTAQGVDNIVVDSSSIEVNRHARRAKTGRLDGDKLLAMLLRRHRGERVWSVGMSPRPRTKTRAVHTASSPG